MRIIKEFFLISSTCFLSLSFFIAIYLYFVDFFVCSMVFLVCFFMASLGQVTLPNVS